MRPMGRVDPLRWALVALAILVLSCNAAAAGRPEPVQAPVLTVEVRDEYDPFLSWDQQEGVTRYYVWLCRDDQCCDGRLPLLLLDVLPGSTTSYLWAGGLPVWEAMTFVIEARGGGSFVRSNMVAVTREGLVRQAEQCGGATVNE
jgi:hypothetical protein